MASLSGASLVYNVPTKNFNVSLAGGPLAIQSLFEECQLLLGWGLSWHNVPVKKVDHFLVEDTLGEQHLCEECCLPFGCEPPWH